MPIAGYLLMFLNIVAALGFTYLASLDYDMRLRWSREVFRHELVLSGLPIDEKDPGHRVDQALMADLDDPYAPVLFTPGTGTPVLTQQQELERVRDALKARLEGMPEDVRRDKLRTLFLGQAYTFDERQEVIKRFADPKNKTDELKAEFLKKFADVLTEDMGPDKKQSNLKRRAEIAHLLFNLDPAIVAPANDKDKIVTHYRLGVVLGLRALVGERIQVRENQGRTLRERFLGGEAENQAYNLREMVERTRQETLDDQAYFENEYARQKAYLLKLAAQYDKERSQLQEKQGLINTTQEQIKSRKQEIEDLKTAYEKAKDDTEVALKKQNELEQELFGIQKQIGSMIEENRKLEREIRTLELGRSRGGQP